jgi:16S rRNA (uracil1498-N3)-methyltransferase
MSNIRLFFKESLSFNLTGSLDKPQSHYVSKVMRVKVGEVFSLFNSSGEWEAKILGISKSIIKFNVTKQLRQKESIKELWLAFSPIKSNYFNFMIQKATELGVTKFLPVIFDRTIVRKINKDRLEKVIIEAAEQSNRINVPSIDNPRSLRDLLNNEKMNLIFTDLNSQNKKLDFNKLNNNPICIIIGPEGDFSEEERGEILSFIGVQPIKLNENILRSETAVISALSIISYFTNH